VEVVSQKFALDVWEFCMVSAFLPFIFIFIIKMGVEKMYEERIEESDSKFDYDAEFDKIENRQSSNFLKLPIGIHKILVLSEPEKTFYTQPDTKEVTIQIKMVVNYSDKQYEWYIPVGKTEVSLYAQLIYVGKKTGGLKGKILELVVNTTVNRKGEVIKKYELLNFVRLKQAEQNEMKTQQLKTFM